MWSIFSLSLSLIPSYSRHDQYSSFQTHATSNLLARTGYITSSDIIKWFDHVQITIMQHEIAYEDIYSVTPPVILLVRTLLGGLVT